MPQYEQSQTWGLFFSQQSHTLDEDFAALVSSAPLLDLPGITDERVIG
jgi:hypothetical protein